MVLTTDSMASNLTEADIPQAALGNRDPEALKVEVLVALSRGNRVI